MRFGLETKAGGMMMQWGMLLLRCSLCGFPSTSKKTMQQLNGGFQWTSITFWVYN